MKTALILVASLGLAAAVINLDEIRRDPATKGWFVGLGLLVFVGCWFWASAS